MTAYTAARVSKFSFEGQTLISPNLHTIKTAFCKLFFHFPLMKAEVSAETLGLLVKLYIILYNFNQSKVFIFLNMYLVYVASFRN